MPSVPPEQWELYLHTPKPENRSFYKKLTNPTGIFTTTVPHKDVGLGRADQLSKLSYSGETDTTA